MLEKIVPYTIRKTDYHDFEKYSNSLKEKNNCRDLVPDSTFFCMDEKRNIFVGAVNIRHYLNESLLLNGEHIGDGVRASLCIKEHFYVYALIPMPNWDILRTVIPDWDRPREIYDLPQA